MSSQARREIFIEPRWPIALAVGFYSPSRSCCGSMSRPPDARHALARARPNGRVARRAVLANPAHIEGRARWLHRVAGALILALAAVALASTSVLIADLVRGEQVTEKASTLPFPERSSTRQRARLQPPLLAFRQRGPLARYRGDRPYRRLCLHAAHEPGARARGLAAEDVDYLILGLTTSTAFSPTDVMPMSAWAKLTMALQSIISLVVVGLVIARAVNVLVGGAAAPEQAASPGGWAAAAL